VAYGCLGCRGVSAERMLKNRDQKLNKECGSCGSNTWTRDRALLIEGLVFHRLFEVSMTR